MKLQYGMYIIIIVAIVVLGGCTAQTTQPQAVQNTPVQTAASATSPVKEFNMTAKQWEFIPATITVNKGDTVKLKVTSIDVMHGFGLADFGINKDLPPGTTVDIQFVADKTGTFTFKCTVPCGSGHREMTGQLIVN